MKYHAQFLLDKEKNNTESAKIRYRVKWNGNIVAFNIGYRVDIQKWSTEVQRCKNNTTHGKKKIPFNVINKRVQEYQNACEDLFTEYELNGLIPDKEEFKRDFLTKIGRNTPKNKNTKFWEVYDKFVAEESIRNQWNIELRRRYVCNKKHLYNFDKNFSFKDLTEDKFLEFQRYLQNDLQYRNTTIGNALVRLKFFAKWAVKKGYCDTNDWNNFKLKAFTTQKKIIFLTQEEIKKVQSFAIPQSHKELEITRDIFMFQCFTGLRYSDVQNLKTSDIKANHIEVTTLKTTDSLMIDLNSYSKAILNKYKGKKHKNNSVFPFIFNQKMNENLRELMCLAEIDEPIRETYYIGKKRYDKVLPKYAVITTHAGRRTFICTALSLGIPPQVVMKWTGHKDYKAMKPYIDIADSVKANAMEKFNLL